jgi:uncharacterized protein YjbI with pentapeptide repeats
MADFIRADLRGSRFEHVDLSGAQLRAVDLTGARLRAVDLTGVVMRNVERSGSTGCTPSATSMPCGRAARNGAPAASAPAAPAGLTAAL